MATVTLDKSKKTLTIVLPYDEEGHPSGTGKTMNIASTGGNKPTGVKLPNGKEIIVGVNAYYKPGA